jgi:hypothetical protein
MAPIRAGIVGDYRPLTDARKAATADFASLYARVRSALSAAMAARMRGDLLAGMAVRVGAVALLNAAAMTSTIAAMRSARSSDGRPLVAHTTDSTGPSVTGAGAVAVTGAGAATGATGAVLRRLRDAFLLAECATVLLSLSRNIPGNWRT